MLLIGILPALQTTLPLKTGSIEGYHPTRFQDPHSGVVIEIQWVESLSDGTARDTPGHPSTVTVTATNSWALGEGGEA